MSKLSDEKTFNLTEIKEFNPGLIYGFEPEASIQGLDLGSIEHLFHVVSQFQDMYNAYLYAQNQILSVIRKEGIAAVSNEQLLIWINQIHKYIADTLAQDHKVSAGEFTKTQILRWHPNDTMIPLIQCLFVGIQPSGLDIKAELKAMKVDPSTVEKFIELMRKVSQDQTIQLTTQQIQDLPPSTNPLGRRIQQALYKLANSFHMDKFKNQELEVINKIVTICPVPSSLPELMQTFSKELLTKWQKCDPKDIDQVAELAFFAFFQLTEIHPYFNCNGRTATCLLNIILRSLNYPSILICLPSERNNEKSQYRQAIDNIKTQPQLLTNLIKTKLTADSAYEDQGLAQTICKRIEFRQKLIQLTEYLTVKSLNKYYSQWNKLTQGQCQPIYDQIDLYLKSKDSMLEPNILEKYNALMIKYNRPQITNFSISAIKNGVACFCLETYLPQAESLRQKLASDKKTTPVSSISVSPVIKRQYSLEEKNTIVKKLKSLTGQTDWKKYNNNGTLAVLLTHK